MARLNLVTGAFGFSGSYVVRELLAAGERVVATDRADVIDNADRRATLSATGVPLAHPHLEVVPSDLLAPDSLGPLLARRPTHVFHTASLYDYSAPLERLMRINVDGTRNLVEAVRRTGSVERFIHWSTCGVFGKPYTARDGARVNVPFTEDSPSPKTAAPDERQPRGTHLVNDYSISKWEQEKMMWRLLRDGDLPLTVIRPAPMYGPGSSYGHGGIMLIVAQGFLPAFPSDARNYVTTSVHALDVARFALHAANRPDTVGEDYNVVDSSIISYHEFLAYIALLTGQKLRTIPLVNLASLRPLAVAAAHTWKWLADKHGIKRVRVFEIQSTTYISSSYWIANRKTLATGFEYRYPDVREGLKDTIAWMREQGWLLDPARLMV